MAQQCKLLSREWWGQDNHFHQARKIFFYLLIGNSLISVLPGCSSVKKHFLDLPIHLSYNLLSIRERPNPKCYLQELSSLQNVVREGRGRGVICVL